MAARISDKVSARNLANDEPIQAYEADGVTVVDLLKVNASDQISIAVDGQDVVIGGTVNARNIATDGTKLDGIEASADVTDTANVVAALTAGTNITIAANGTIASTDTNTTYSIGDGGLTTNDFTNADHTKLDGIAIGANNYTLPAGYATETYVGTQISNLVDSSPAALNTLNELAAAIGDDANFSTTVTNNIATKLPLAGGTLTGNLAVTGDLTVSGHIKPLGTATIPTWDTNTYVWSESGYGARFDGYQMKFDTGSARTTALTIDISQNVSIPNGNLTVTGTIRNSTAPLNYVHGAAANLVVGNSGGNGGLTIASASSAATSIHFARGSVGTDQYRGYLNYAHSTDIMNFGTSGAARMSLSATGGLNVTGNITASGKFLRTTDNSGYQIGHYNIAGSTTTAATGPIYVMGTSYKPTTTALSNMYGIGYTHHNASFLSFTGGSGFGMYVASDGDARIWLDGGNGVISSTGNHYVGANKVWHAGDAVVATSLTAGAKTIAGNLTVGSGTSSWIYMVDSDHGNRSIHCNSNRIGFINQAGNWSAYSEDSGLWTCASGVYSTAANNTMGYLTMTDGIRVEGTGITYPGATAAGGSGSRIGFRWVSPHLKATISNSAVITVGTASDYRIKDTITNDIGDALSMLESLPTYNFYSKGEESKTVYTGVLAHELESIIPSLVTGEKDNPKQLQSVDYAGLTPFLIQALKQVTARLRAVEALLEIEPAELVVEDFVKVESPDFDWPEEEPDVGIPVK